MTAINNPKVNRPGRYKLNIVSYRLSRMTCVICNERPAAYDKVCHCQQCHSQYNKSKYREYKLRAENCRTCKQKRKVEVCDNCFGTDRIGGSQIMQQIDAYPKLIRCINCGKGRPKVIDCPDCTRYKRKKSWQDDYR